MAAACALGAATTEDPSLLLFLAGHKKPIRDISFSPDDKQLAACNEDGSIMVWNMSQTGRSYKFTGHSDAVTSLEYSNDGKILASCSKDTTVRLWLPAIRGGSTSFKAHTSAVNCLSFSPDNTKIITGSNDKCIKLWDASRKSLLASFVGHNNWVCCAKYTPCSSMMVSCSSDRTVRLWDVNTGQCLHVFTNSSGSRPNYVSIHRNNPFIAVAMNTGSVRVYDMRNKKLQQYYMLHDDTTCVSWHPQANYLLSCGKDGKIIFTDVMEGRPVYTISGYEGEVIMCKFNGNGDYFAVGGADKYGMVWKTNFI